MLCLYTLQSTNIFLMLCNFSHCCEKCLNKEFYKTFLVTTSFQPTTYRQYFIITYQRFGFTFLMWAHFMGQIVTGEAVEEKLCIDCIRATISLIECGLIKVSQQLREKHQIPYCNKTSQSFSCVSLEMSFSKVTYFCMSPVCVIDMFFPPQGRTHLLIPHVKLHSHPSHPSDSSLFSFGHMTSFRCIGTYL